LEAEQAALADPTKRNAFQLCAHFWVSEFPKLAAQTRSSIVSTFTTLADALLRDPFRDRFCTETTFVPEMLFKGAICIADLDIKRYGDVGQYAQVLLKYVNSFLGNLVNKFFCQQDEELTNRWAADTIGKVRQLLNNYSHSHQTADTGFYRPSATSGAGETIDYDCPPREFQLLANGGSRNGYTVEAIAFGGGRVWSNGKTWIRIRFRQRAFKDKTG
jgi:hypothetical protein